MIIEALIMFLGVLAWDIISDYRKWLKRKTVKHKLEWALRVALLLPSAIGFAGELTQTNFVWGLLWSYLLLGSLYWILFDGLYNVLRGFKWTFLGSVDKDESVLDSLLRRIGEEWAIVCKVVFLASCITIYLTQL